MKNKLWILAINRSRARILRDLGSDAEAGCRDLALRAPHAGLRSALPEVEAVEAARRVPSLSQRSAWRERLAADHADFLRHAVQCLEAHRLAGDFQRLAVFAPPDILPALRAVMPARLRARICAEFAEDVTDLPPDRLRATVLSTLGIGALANGAGGARASGD